MDIRFKFPTKWDELSEWQLKKIGNVLYKNETFESNVFLALVIVILSMPKPTIKNFLKSAVLFWRVPFSDLHSYASFVLDENSHLTKFPVSLKAGRKRLYGPAPRLSNLSIIELSYADTFYFNWRTDKKSVDLERLVAVLYRLPISKRKNSDDIRVPFNKLLLPQRATLTDKISKAEKYIVGLAYEGSRRALISRYKNVFPVPLKSEEEEDAPKVQKKTKPYQPFSKIITAMALEETQPFGKMQDAELANAITFLEIYDESLARQKEQERNRKK